MGCTAPSSVHGAEGKTSLLLLCHLSVLLLVLCPPGLQNIAPSLRRQQSAPLVIDRVPELQVMPRRNHRAAQLFGASATHAARVEPSPGVRQHHLRPVGATIVIHRSGALFGFSAPVFYRGAGGWQATLTAGEDAFVGTSPTAVISAGASSGLVVVTAVRLPPTPFPGRHWLRCEPEEAFVRRGVNVGAPNTLGVAVAGQSRCSRRRWCSIRGVHVSSGINTTLAR